MYTYFPEKFDSVQQKEFYQLLRHQILLKCESIKNGEQNTEIDKIDIDLITFVKPIMFAGAENAEINHDKSFANLNFTILRETGKDAKEMTVFELYSTLQILKTVYKNGRKPAKNK